MVTIHPGRVQRAARPVLATAIARHPLLAYFALAFAFSWAVMIPIAADSRGWIRFDPPLPVLAPLVLVMGYGPTWAALLVTGVTQGRAGVRSLLSRMVRWRVGVRWYGVVLGLPAGVLLAGAGLVSLFGGTASLPAMGPVVLLTFPGQVLAHSLVNGEEFGWRGFALPRLQARYGALVAGLLLGVVWALFHLPIFFVQGDNLAGSQNRMPVHGFLLSTIVLSVLATWVFNHTQGSVLLATLFHGATNEWTSVLSAPTSGTLYWVQLGVSAAVAVIVVAAGGLTGRAARPAVARWIGRGASDASVIATKRLRRGRRTPL